MNYQQAIRALSFLLLALALSSFFFVGKIGIFALLFAVGVLLLGLLIERGVNVLVEHLSRQ